MLRCFKLDIKPSKMSLLFNVVSAFLLLFLVYQYNVVKPSRRVGAAKLPPGPKGIVALTTVL